MQDIVGPEFEKLTKRIMSVSRRKKTSDLSAILFNKGISGNFRRSYSKINCLSNDKTRDNDYFLLKGTFHKYFSPRRNSDRKA